MSNSHRIDTQLVHAGEPRPRVGGAATAPIFLSTVFEYQEGAAYDDILYPRLNNLPNQRLVAEKMAALEGGEDAVPTSSGMAAISTTLLAVLGSGGHLLAQRTLYGGTLSFLSEDLPALGCSASAIDADAPETWEAFIRPQTRAILVEAVTNPLVDVADHRAIVEFARAHGLVTIIDSTFATPINFRPLALGYDIVIHSATKYLNGHSDLVGGVVVGSGESISKVRHRLNHLGGCLEPLACYLLTRGLKTLGLRVRRQNEVAFTIASALESRPEIEVVHYPGLASHPRHERARALFAGFGGMLSFEIAGGVQAARRFLDSVDLLIHGPSLGGVETLVTSPALTSHRGLTPEQRVELGISDSLIRMSVGIEDPEDLLADIDRALRASRGRSPV